MTRRPTIHDVAEKAGVSKSLVALVFKQDSGVSQKRRELVLQAAKELGYTPNPFASALRSGNNGFVGIVVADFHNPLFTEFADLARQAFAARGIFSFIATASVSVVDGVERIDAVPIQHLLDLKPASLLIVGGLADHTPFRNINDKLPVVQVLSSKGDLKRAVSVRCNEDQAMKLLLDHLEYLGHKSIVYIGPEGERVAEDRRKAYANQAKKHKVKVHMVSTSISKNEESGLAAGLIALQMNPTALVCFNDNVAFGVQDALARKNSKVAVTGFDNTFFGNLERISLTTIDQNKDLVVSKVVELLTDSKQFAKYRGEEILIEPGLVIRDSTSKPQKR
jgi:DNA-binding LacI/PurR family transcriptional regulator